jgi:hypothetical protein
MLDVLMHNKGEETAMAVVLIGLDLHLGITRLSDALLELIDKSLVEMVPPNAKVDVYGDIRFIGAPDADRQHGTGQA